MKIKRFVGGSLQSNGYIVYENEGGQAFVIDPGFGGDSIRYLTYIKDKELNVTGILLTHYHHDHVGAVENLKQELRIPVYLHKDDVDKYNRKVDKILEDGDTISFDSDQFKVIHTPGHTRGGVCYYSEKSKSVFTGDTIFNVDIGRTDFSDGNPEQMKESMQNVIDKWNDDITIYPGHGDSATMKFVRENNSEFLYALSL